MEIGGIEIAVVRKKIKNMYLRVLPPDGRVQITAPSGLRDGDVRRFAESKIDWILRKQKDVTVRAETGQRDYVTGETFYLWGDSFLLEVRDGETEGCVFYGGKDQRDPLPGNGSEGSGRLLLSVRPGASSERRKKILSDWYRAQLREKAESLLPECEALVGVQVKELRIRDMRTRWGTCNTVKARVWLSLRLAQKPEECLKYVLVHELVHLLEPSHNKRFYALMDRFYPNWRAVKKRLNGR